MPRTPPAQKRHRSKQDYGTPPALIDAIARRFGGLTFDAAASAGNAVTRGYFSANEPDHPSALTVDWSRVFTRQDLVFLNPEFGSIGHVWAPLVSYWTTRLPWLRLVMLTPASVAAEWFQLYVHRRAVVLPLSPRLTFVGCDEPYPKDCMLSVFGLGVAGFEPWRWDDAPLERPKILPFPRPAVAPPPGVPEAAMASA